jgi:SAM-dependent methyltransferase
MPGSVGLFDDLIRSHISKTQPMSILDVGCGSGNYAHMKQFGAPNATIEAVEPTERYWSEYDLENKYDVLHKMTVQDFTKTDNYYDLTMCIDVLEHLYLSEAIDMIECLAYSSQYIIIAWPTDVNQSCWEGNPYEKHKSNMTLSDLTRFDIVHYEKTPLDRLMYHYACIKTMHGKYITR